MPMLPVSGVTPVQTFTDKRHIANGATGRALCGADAQCDAADADA